ncbi:GNAT family N-acetyltransferase [Bradyrhizobium sp. CCGUVB4N]|uniref:GNAT family N-acetyltransferase n=1 Tax=Bradyrhizobium sp. CCGUVB4N TaxID=2949631 RepID=UPI0020B3ADA6|nr:GNAT family N-acetyltransferase [Bradyrhizobium sp. CCGUVB4N]MCP3385966.1 GNAT family N-acetyltransferase [Bradyrhizobium sp. CCGUVB4N]
MSITTKPSSEFFTNSYAIASAKPTTEIIDFRPLNPEDFQAFRAIRLEALSGPDAKYFGASYEKESAQPDASWIERCRQTTEKALFGAFLSDQVVGVMAATKSDKHERTVLWGSVYLRPQHRNRHVAERLYQMRQQWSEARGLFDRAIFFIREGNERSTAIHVKNGAKVIGREEMDFADCSRGTALWFEKKLTAHGIT